MTKRLKNDIQIAKKQKSSEMKNTVSEMKKITVDAFQGRFEQAEESTNKKIGQ